MPGEGTSNATKHRDPPPTHTCARAPCSRQVFFAVSNGSLSLNAITRRAQHNHSQGIRMENPISRVCVHVYVCVCMRVRACMCVCARARVRVCARVHVCVWPWQTDC